MHHPDALNSLADKMRSELRRMMAEKYGTDAWLPDHTYQVTTSQDELEHSVVVTMTVKPDSQQPVELHGGPYDGSTHHIAPYFDASHQVTVPLPNGGRITYEKAGINPTTGRWVATPTQT